MRTVPDTDLQFSRALMNANEKKRKLEENLRTLDVRSQLLVDSAARKDIEAYKKRHVMVDVANFAMMTADNLRKQI
jgi:hypothetical protein